MPLVYPKRSTSKLGNFEYADGSIFTLCGTLSLSILVILLITTTG